jgi:type II secretory pathway pseudopilin PulG
MRNKQKGFSLVEGLLIFVIVGILASTCWYVWSSNKKTNDLLNKADKSSSTISRQSTQDKKSTSEVKAQATQYLDIKEWKVRLPLSTQIYDAYYVPSNSSQDSNGQPNTVWLGVKSLDGTGECAASNANKGGKPLAGLVKVSTTDTDPVSGDSYKNKYPDGTVINNYYYGYTSRITNSPCTKEATYQIQLREVNAALTTAAKNIVAE